MNLREKSVIRKVNTMHLRAVDKNQDGLSLTLLDEPGMVIQISDTEDRDYLYDRIMEAIQYLGL